MIVLDANILLYAYDSSSSRHKRAREWVEHAFSTATSVGIPWQTIAAFVRVTTNTRLPGDRLTLLEAAEVIDSWLKQPNVMALAPGEAHWGILRRVAIDGQARGPAFTDAQLAALTIEFGGVLHTADQGFARFRDLRWINPLD